MLHMSNALWVKTALLQLPDTIATATRHNAAATPTENKWPQSC
jgi:hypothetical protein